MKQKESAPSSLFSFLYTNLSKFPKDGPISMHHARVQMLVSPFVVIKKPRDGLCQILNWRETKHHGPQGTLSLLSEILLVVGDAKPFSSVQYAQSSDYVKEMVILLIKMLTHELMILTSALASSLLVHFLESFVG